MKDDQMHDLPIFKQNEKAIIHSVPNWKYNNTECTIVGLANVLPGDNNFYIIELCHPTNDEDGWTHTVLSNACLKKVSK